MRYAVSVGFLGYTRCNNVCVYNPESRGFDDLTPAEARRYIDRKQLKGVLWRNGDEGPEFYPDDNGFNQKDIMIKSANKFRPMLHDVLAGNPVNSFLTVVRVLDTDYRGRLYEVVSNKYSRLKITEQNLRELNEITVIAGVWITDNEIKVCDGVQYENRKADAAFSKGTYKDGIAIECLPSTKDMMEDKPEPAEDKPEEKTEEAPVEQDKSEPAEEKTEETSEEAPVEQSETDKKEPESLEDIFGSVQEQMEEQVAEKEEQPEGSKEQKTEKSTPKSGKRTPKKK